MPASVRILAALPEGTDTEPFEQACQGAKFHSPTPVRVRLVSLTPDLSIWLCGTCEANLDVYISLGTQTWETRRDFGNQIRAWGDLVVRASGHAV